MSTTSSKSMAGGKSKVVDKGTTVAIEDGAGREDQSIKYIHEANGTWMVMSSSHT